MGTGNKWANLVLMIGQEGRERVGRVLSIDNALQVNPLTLFVRTSYVYRYKDLSDIVKVFHAL